MSVEFDLSQLRQTLDTLSRFSSSDSPFLARALNRAGSVLATQIRVELRRSGLRRRTGDLANSIDYRIERRGNEVVLEAGSFGVRYAAIHEFGGIVNIPAHIRTQTQVFGRPLDSPIQVNVRAHTKTFTARPFVRPAVLRQAENIANIIQEEMANAIR
jgi:phage gpG-like protein